MMANEPTLVPEMIDRVEESLAVIAGEVIQSGKKRVLVTLAEGSDSEGRPLGAVALARALARTDARVVLVDFRSDGANAASMGESENLPGFSDLFDGEASFAQVIFRDRKSRVHFIPAGLRRFSRQDLADERVALLVNALDHTYDHVVFDVAGDFLEAIGSECDAAVVATEFDRDDPRTVHLIELVRVHSQARIVVCRIDPVEAGEMSGLAVERAVADAAA
jgi:MinD-like ATPase involved in chromosome partitioning or flagellar assembly